jgi:excinuclease UvrABC nuclease subunit
MQNQDLKEFSLEFNGYWREINKGGIPAKSGIYLVYRCVYNSDKDTVGLKDIIYIGKSTNVHNRIANHDKFKEFNAQLRDGEELCYAFAEVAQTNLDIVENALVFAQKPVLNDDLKNSYNYDAVAIKIDGRCACMKYTDFKIS